MLSKSPHNDAFLINLTLEQTISMDEAIKIARKAGLAEFVYSADGIYSSESWYWCAEILEILQQEDLIREYEIVTGPSVEVEAEEGVVY